MKNILKPFSVIIFSLFLFIGACDDGSGVESFDLGSVVEDPPLDNPDSAEKMSIKFLPSANAKADFQIVHYQVLPTFDFESSCEIDKDEASNKDLTCVADVNEQDLYFHGLRIQFILPTGMCHYVKFYNHWHWNREYGSGPPVVWVRNYLDDLNKPSGTPECFVQNSDGNWYPSDPNADGLPANNGVLGTGTNCENLGGLAGLELTSIDSSSGKPRCIYDRSHVNGVNCCTGNYTLVKETIDNSTELDPISKGSVILTDQSYGSQQVSQCLAGPAMADGSWPKSSLGYPVPRVYFTRESGFADRYVIKPPMEIFNVGHNQIVSNWHAGVESGNRHQHVGTISGRTSLLPIFHDPIEDRSGDFFHIPGQSPYEFHCLDEADDVLHRIRLYVREYNTRREFLNFIANPINGTQDADRTGVEGGGGVNDCEGFIGGPCNDYSDADDFNPNVIGSSPPYNCSTSEGALFSFSAQGCFPATQR